MDATEYKLTTGKKVNSALDDPIAYFTSQEHLQRSTDLQSRKDEMSEAIQTIKAADNGITGIEDLIASAKSMAQSALSATSESDMTDYITQYNELLSQIDDLAEDSGYSGVNLLGGSSQTLEVNFDEKGDSKITLTGFDSSSGTSGLKISQATAATWYTGTDATDDFAATKTAINAAIDSLDSAKDTLRTKSKSLSNQLSIVTARQDFTTGMITTLGDGSANLINADTTTEGVNLTTLQTQQSLAVKSLSIANSASQAVLSLFQ